MCEVLGCAPSELKTKHPNLTIADKLFLIRYGLEKMEALAVTLGFRRPSGTLTKDNR